MLGIRALTITWISQSAVLDRRAFRISEKSPTHRVQNPTGNLNPRPTASKTRVFMGNSWVREARKLNCINRVYGAGDGNRTRPKLGKLLFSEKVETNDGNGRMDEAS